MSFLRFLDLELFLLFTLVLTRVSGLMMTAPIYGTKDIPATVRALLTFAIAVLVMPTQLGRELHDPGTTLNYLVMIGSELLVGVFLGMGMALLLTGVQMAGELMSRIGGLSMSDIFDPAFDANVPLFSKLMALVCTAAFVAIGGHRMVLGGLLDTFVALPPGGCVAAILDSAQTAGSAGTPWLQSLMDTFVVLIAESCNLAVCVSAPVVTALLLATLVLGLISRTLPQLNVLVVGFGLNSILSFAIFSVTLGAGVLAFQDKIEPTLDILLQTIRSASH